MDGPPALVVLVLSAMFGSGTYAALRRNPKWYMWVVNMVIGTSSGTIFAPLLCEWRGWEGMHAANGAAFGLGLLGVTVCRLVVDGAENKAIQNWLRAKWGLPPVDWKMGEQRPPSDSDVKPANGTSAT